MDNKTLGDSKEYYETTEGRNKIKKQKMCKRQKSKEFKLTSTLTLKLNVNVNVKVKRKGLSHLMGEASCPSFIGRVWSGAQ